MRGRAPQEATFPVASENVFDADGGVEDVLQPLNDTAPATATNQRGWPSWRDGMRRILSLSDNSPFPGLLEQQISARLSGMQGGGAAADADGGTLPADGATGFDDEDRDRNSAAAAIQPAMPDVPRGDITAAARWLEDAMPFLMLLLVVFLYRHLLTILIFFWLTSMLHNSNERMRTQTLLKENRSRRALLTVAAILFALVSAISLLQASFTRRRRAPLLAYRTISLPRALRTASSPSRRALSHLPRNSCHPHSAGHPPATAAVARSLSRHDGRPSRPLDAALGRAHGRLVLARRAAARKGACAATCCRRHHVTVSPSHYRKLLPLPPLTHTSCPCFVAGADGAHRSLCCRPPSQARLLCR